MQPNEFTRVDPHTGRPCLGWSNMQWQEYYAVLKLKITPSVCKTMKGGFHSYTVNGIRIQENVYSGETNYQQYRIYINSVLRTIRSANHAVDFCYYIYQIADLLQFEPELMTRFNNSDKYAPHFEVWLEQ